MTGVTYSKLSIPSSMADVTAIAVLFFHSTLFDGSQDSSYSEPSIHHKRKDNSLREILMWSIRGILCNGLRVTNIFSLILLQNLQLISNEMKDCSENFKNLNKDMATINNRMTVLQERFLVTKNATLPEDAMSQDK
jgi:hypothetical protein